MRQINLVLFLLISLQASFSVAQTVSERLQVLLGESISSRADAFLDPEQAFVFSAVVDAANQISLGWEVAEGYYLYRHRFSVSSVNAELGQWSAPAGKVKQDKTFGKMEVNTGRVEFTVPVLSRPADNTVVLDVHYQGCKEDAICYPPIDKTVSIRLPENSGDMAVNTEKADEMMPKEDPQATLSAQDNITEKLKNSHFIINIFAFFVFGLLLSLTPCVFPMIPILSGIIVNQSKALSPTEGFVLSLTYVLAMSLTYAVSGVLAGLLEINIQAAAQNTWVLMTFSLIFVFLALSMFGLYEIQLPAAVQSRLHGLSAAQGGGGLKSVAVMGAVSAIIVGPCVAPPLAGALLYISQTGNAVLGGVALFFMGLGFGVPLLLIGLSAGSLLPRAGAWMESIKAVFGVVMLAVAIWFLERIFHGPVALLMWGALFIVCAVYLGALDASSISGWKKMRKGFAIMMLIYGVSLVIGAIAGANDMFKPLSPFTGGNVSVAHEQPAFKRISTVTELDEEIRLAAENGKTVLLDFYADWCITCIEMEKKTFVVPAVTEKMAAFVLLQADVTANNAADKALLSRFNIFGPPAILFFKEDGNELKNMRLVGFVPATAFLQHLNQVLP